MGAASLNSTWLDRILLLRETRLLAEALVKVKQLAREQAQMPERSQ
jgi:hypothetical protein